MGAQEGRKELRGLRRAQGKRSLFPRRQASHSTMAWPPATLSPPHAPSGPTAASPLHALQGLGSPRVLTPGRLKSQRYTGCVVVHDGVPEAGRAVSGEKLEVVTPGRQGGLPVSPLSGARG